jgi:hypothetical protein
LAAHSPADVRSQVEEFLRRRLAGPPWNRGGGAPPADQPGAADTAGGVKARGGGGGGDGGGGGRVEGGGRVVSCGGFRLFRGVADDVKRRAPHYAADWTDALQDLAGFTTCLSAIMWMYFSTLAPALALGIVLREVGL